MDIFQQITQAGSSTACPSCRFDMDVDISVDVDFALHLVDVRLGKRCRLGNNACLDKYANSTGTSEAILFS